MIDHLAVHFAMEGELVHVSTDEGREQAALKQQVEERKSAIEAETVESVEATLAGKPLRNQFNFSERATQTFNNPRRDRKVATEPPPMATFSAVVNRWEIYDTYVEDYERTVGKPTKSKGREEESGAEAADGAHAGGTLVIGHGSAKASPEDILKSEKLLRTLKLMERLVVQNDQYDLFWRFKYFEDRDEFSRADGMGSVTPLWRIAYEKAKKKTVTCISWNPKYHDLFAVSFGSYDFLRQPTNGLIGIFSLKNTSNPECTFTTESGAMCVDWHPDHPALLAAGLYDGTVCVYDVRDRSGKPLFVSTNPKTKHTDPVWQVRWARDESGRNLNFYSISSDGRVTNWIINKNELVAEDVVQIKLVPKREEGNTVAAASATAAEPPVSTGLAGGSCMDWNRLNEHLFVVGTEEGSLHCYSKTFHTQYLRTYEGHNMAVYAAKWNPFHPRIFLTCSADWSVRLWEQNTNQPLMTFDMMTAVADIAWAPYSSTVFAAITHDILRIYDLSVRKHDYICLEQPNRLRKEDAKSKMTHVAFNPSYPIIVIGDDRGVLRIFKLGPNLRKMSAPNINELNPAEEQQKLERLLTIPDKSPDAETLNALQSLGPLPLLTKAESPSSSAANRPARA